MAEVEVVLSLEVLIVVKVVVVIMGMNNVYYCFVYLVLNKDYGMFLVKFCMNVIGVLGVEKISFEFWFMVVFVVNGCGMCMDVYEVELCKYGLIMI